jgi:L-histidine Nalpha-methyltransferase
MSAQGARGERSGRNPAQGRAVAHLSPERFAHVATWDPVEQWIEMRLRATEAMSVRLATIGMAVEFAAGEDMRTEISAKFTRERVRSELAAGGGST